MMRNTATTGKRLGYGWLYNWHAVNHASGLAPDGWRVITYDDLHYIAYDILGGELSSPSTLYAGGKMKSNIAEWKKTNIITANNYNINIHPAGIRSSTSGEFAYLLEQSLIWTGTPLPTGTSAYFGILYFGGASLYNFPNNGTNIAVGGSVRCVRNATVAELAYTDGAYCDTLQDVDGNRYKTIKIGDYVLMAENLRTTKYKNEDAIPEITGNTAWTDDTAGARCAYNNDHYFVYPPGR